MSVKLGRSFVRTSYRLLKILLKGVEPWIVPKYNYVSLPGKKDIRHS